MSTIAKKIDTKTWIIIGLGGVTVVAGYALFSQWKHASLGRQVRRNVVRFLKDHGAVAQNGIMTGGVVQQPMKVDTAVNATVIQMLNSVADQMAAGGGVPRPPLDDEDLGAVGMNPATAMDGYATYASMPPPRVHNKSPGKRSPIKGSVTKSPRQQRKGTRAGATPASPLEVSKTFRDDGGYSVGAGRGGRGGQRSSASFEYNPDDMVPKGKHAPQRKSVFTDDEGEDDGAVGPVENDSDDEYQ